VKRRGFNLVEIILALAVLLVAFVYTFSAFSKSARHAVQSRNRKLAILTAQSLLEEVRAHEWGRPAPKQWPLDKFGPVSYQFVVSKRQQKADFEVELQLQTGALIGKVVEPSDKAIVKVRWEENGPHEISADLLLASPL